MTKKEARLPKGTRRVWRAIEPRPNQSPSAILSARLPVTGSTNVFAVDPTITKCPSPQVPASPL